MRDGLLRTVRSIGGVVVLIVLITGTLGAQWQEYRLPNRADVTGMAFRPDGRGLITTADSTAYRVALTRERTATFTPVPLRTGVYFGVTPYAYMPFWTTDSVVYFWQSDRPPTYDHLMRSRDAGASWQDIDTIWRTEFCADRIPVPDTTFILLFQTDALGEIYLRRYGNSGTVLSRISPPYHRETLIPYYPEGVALSRDTLLLSTWGDSLAYYALATDSFTFRVPEIAVDARRGAFTELARHPSGAIVGQRNAGVFHSRDGGQSWELVLPERHLQQLSLQPDGTWYGLSGGTIWDSRNAGRTWHPTEFQLPSGYTHFAVVDNDWLWLGGDSGKVALSAWPPLTVIPPNPYPSAFRLQQNYPNPFNTQTTIPFTIPERGQVLVEVYSLRGRKIETLMNRVQTPGEYELIWYARDVSTGVYFVRFQAGTYQQVRKMVVVK